MLYQTVREGRLPAEPSESELVKIWQYQLLDRTSLVTEDGEPIRIVYPGRVNDDQGADFRDAVIATSQGLINGDIELHVKSAYWQAHRHHRDAAYNRVILHVVMWHNQNTMTSLQNGTRISVLALHKYIKTPVSQWLEQCCPENLPCATASQRLARDALTEIIEKAGKERFLIKAAKLKDAINQMESGQTLYQGIMVALGYAKNEFPFAELARRLPLEVLESVAQEPVSDEDCLAKEQALLLGTAGFLPESGEGNKWMERKMWASRCNVEAMSRQDWQLFKVRPNNSPVRRLLAASYLLVRYRHKGILRGLIDLVSEASLNQGWISLEKGLMITDSVQDTLLGRARAADIIVNVLLPFTFAFAQSTSQPEIESKAFNIYCRYPKLAANSIERHMRDQLGIENHLIDSARRQQGLIHIYKNWCIRGRCSECKLS